MSQANEPRRHVVVALTGSECETYPGRSCVMEVLGPFTREEAGQAARRYPEWAAPHLMSMRGTWLEGPAASGAHEPGEGEWVFLGAAEARRLAVLLASDVAGDLGRVPGRRPAGALGKIVAANQGTLRRLLRACRWDQAPGALQFVGLAALAAAGLTQEELAEAGGSGNGTG